MTKRKVDEDIEKINAELKSMRDVPRPSSSSPGSTIRLMLVLSLMVVLAASVLFTYGKISGLQVIGNESFNISEEPSSIAGSTSSCASGSESPDGKVSIECDGSPPQFPDYCDEYSGCQGHDHKVEICHHPPGHPENAQTLCISKNVLWAHVHHHEDYCGPCQQINDTIPPNITLDPLSLYYGQQILIGEGVFFRLIATDDTGISQVYLYITYPDGTNTQIPLEESEEYYEGAFNDTTLPGMYKIDLTAIDIGGNYQTLSNMTFYVSPYKLIGVLNESMITTPYSFKVTGSNSQYVNLSVDFINHTLLHLDVYNMLLEGESKYFYIGHGDDDMDAKQTYSIDLSDMTFESAQLKATAVGNHLYKCPAWNFTTQKCNPNLVCAGGPTKETSDCNYEGGWQYYGLLTPGQEYIVPLTPGDPGYAEYSIDFTAPYCEGGESPCIANTSLLACRDSINDGNGPEPLQPNTIDSCSDGTGAYSTPTCGGDESVENITVTDLNGSTFRAGDTVRVSAWVHCYAATDDHLGLVYSSDAASPSWSLQEFREDGCSAAGYQQITFNDFVLDSNAGNHSVRIYITYDTQNPPPQNTCGLRSSGTSYDDNDDVVFLVSEANTPPTTPTSITCDGGSCNDTFMEDVEIECSGSTDPESDSITYNIYANYIQPTTSSDIESGTSNATGENGPVLGEAGKVEITNGEWKLIEFNAEYSSTPVVIATPATDNTGDDNSLIPTISLLNTTHMNITICQDQGAATCDFTYNTETIHYLVFDTIETTNHGWIDAGTTTVQPNGASNTVNWGTTFTNTPYVFASANTYNQAGNIAASAWIDAISTTQTTKFIGCTHQGTGDSCDPSTPSETYGYVAIDPILANISTLSLGSEDISNSEWTSVTFSGTYASPIMMVLQNDDDGNQDPEYPWARNVGSTGADIRYCEQDAAGVCNSHTSEFVMWAAVQEGELTLEGSSKSYESNTSWTTYNNALSGLSGLDQLQITLGITEYTFAGSLSNSNDLPDIEVQLYNGTDWQSLGNMYVTSTGNYSASTTDSNILQAWETDSNTDIRIRGVNIDYNSSWAYDQILWDSLWISYGGRSWSQIGSHTAGNGFDWNITYILPQSEVDLRCTAIDLTGTSIESSYYDPSINLTIAAPDHDPPGTILSLTSPSKGPDWIYWTWINPVDQDFLESILYLNGSNVVNTSSQEYNATGLTPELDYNLTVNTLDQNDNINDTDVTDVQSLSIPQQPPTHSQPILLSSLGTNTTNENLTCYNQSTADANADQVQNIIDWTLNDTSILLVSTPFEGGSTNISTKEYSGRLGYDLACQATWNRTGGHDGAGAYEFNGVDEYIYLDDVSDASANVFDPVVAERTVMLWYNADSVAGTTYRMLYEEGGTVNGMNIYIYNDRIYAGSWSESDGWTGNWTDMATTAGSWHFAALTHSTSAGTVSLFHDGAISAVSTPTSVAAHTGDDAIGRTEDNTVASPNSGSDRSSTGDYFAGSIDDFMVFDRALSLAQIQAIYSGQIETLVSEETENGDVWSCIITPNDGYADGTGLESNNLTISTFVDDASPSVVINQPSQGQEYNPSSIVIINATVTDNALLQQVSAIVTDPAGMGSEIFLSEHTAGIYTADFTNTIQMGRYNITIIANDTSGNVNDTEKTWFNVTLNVPVQDNESMIMSELTVLADYGDTADIQLIPLDYDIYNVTIFGYNLSEPGTVYIKNQTGDQDFFRTYSVDLSDIDFDTAEVTLQSQGDILYKCVDFNFTTQNCDDDDLYELSRTDLIYGQNYTVILTPLDPGFGEVVYGPNNITDAYFRSGAADTNYGGLTRFRVGRRNAGNIIRGAIKFDLPILPPGAILTSAEVQMYFFRIPGSDVTTARTHGIHRVSQSPARNWTEFGVTWNNYTNTSLWSSAGGDYNTTATDTASLSSAEVGSFISYNVTSDVLDFYQDPSQNFVWIIKDTLEDINTARRDYRSKETGNAARRPRLVINYTIPIIINNVTDNPDPINQSENITITANVTADLGVDSVWVEINDTNYSIVQQTDENAREIIEFIGFENPSTELSKWMEDPNGPAYTDGLVEIINSTHPFSNNPLTPAFTAHSGNYVLAFTDDTFDVLAYANRTVNISGYRNVTITMWKAEESTEATDQFQAYYWNGNSWVQMWSDVDGVGNGAFSGWTEFVYNIPDADLSSDFQIQIRWETSIADPQEHMFIDDINISGVPVSADEDLWVLVHNTSGENGLVNYTVYANDTVGNNAAPFPSNYTVIGPETIPPGTVTALDEQSVGGKWIRWSWTNPADPDLSHVQIWVNGTFYANVYAPTNFYNMTGLIQNTVYEIQTRTEDFNGNVNTTWVNDTARTKTLNGTIVLDGFEYEQTQTVMIEGADWDSFQNVTLEIHYNHTSVPGYPKNFTANSTGQFTHYYEIPFNASLGLYNVSAFQVTNFSKNDLEQFNVSNFTGSEATQPLRSGVEMYIYLPPLHNLAGARPEDPFLFVTAFNDNTSFYIEDQDEDGDSDDSRGNETNMLTLDEGQSILVYIENGTDTDIDDGDYFKVVSDKQVAVWAGSNSPFMAYTIPSESGKLDGEEFYIYGRYDPDFDIPLDMVIASYYDDTNVRIYDVTGIASRQDFTNASGYTNITTADLDNLIDNQVLDEGEYLSYINNSLTPGGHTFYVAANKPVAITAGSLREGSDLGGTENFGRDGGYYAVGKDGSTYSDLFYTYVGRGGANLGEDEMYFFTDQQSDVTVETYWKNGTLNETYSFQLNSSNDYYYALSGTNSSPYKKVVASEPIAILCGPYLNEGTGDMADFGTSLQGGGVGTEFNIYVPEPGGTGVSHTILFAFYNDTDYDIYNGTDSSSLASGTLQAGEHYDYNLGTDARLVINSTKNIGVQITNFDDNVGLYAVASPVAFLNVYKTSDIDEVELGDNVTYYITVQNPTATMINNLTIKDNIYNAVSYVVAGEEPPIPGPIVSFNTPDPGITQLEWNKSSLLPGEKVNITIISTPTSENETLLLNRVDAQGIEQGGNSVEGEDSTVVFLVDNTAPVIVSVLDYPDPQEIDGLVTVQAVITDNVFVSQATINMGGVNYSMVRGTGNNFYHYYNGTSLGIYNYTIYASDAKGNSPTPVNGSITILPASDVPPFVQLLQPVDVYTEFTYLTDVNFSCNATDNAGLVNLSLYITDENNQLFSLNQTSSQSGLSGSVQWELELSNGTYTWNCLSYDTDGNRAFSEFNRTVNIIEPDFNAPSVYGLIPPAVSIFNTTEAISLGANVTDVNGVDTVIANITYPNGTVVQLVVYQVGVTEEYNTTFVIPLLEGVYTITFIANDTQGNVNATEFTSFEAAVATHSIFGVVTDADNSTVPSMIYVYNETGHLIWTDNEEYFFRLVDSIPYNITVMPLTGNLNELTFINVSRNSSIINFTRLEDSDEQDMDKPDEIANWTEAISWWVRPDFYFSTAKINFSYGAGTDLVFWKCTDWNFNNRSCDNNNFTSGQDLLDGPNSAVVYLTANDPGAGAGKKPKYNESLIVWDVTNLTDTGRRDSGTFVGEYFDLEDVILTVDRSYRFEVTLTQTNPDAIGIIRDPDYDNIQDDWVVDMTGIDAPNVTQINGTVTINGFTPALSSGSETGTQKLTWDAVPPNRLVEDMDANDTVKFWFVFDIPSNATAEYHDGHFLGKSKGEDAEINNNLSTSLGSPPSQVNLTFPNNGNNTLVNRTITFIWEEAYDPDNQTLTYEINITSEFCSDITDTNISATNYTPIVDLGTYDECGTYNWSVRAYDGYFFGNWSESWNFSIQPYVALAFINDTVDFGTADTDTTNDTVDENPYPFIIRSDGNVRTDVVNVSSNQSFFTSSLTQDSDFQIKVDNTTELNSFNWTGSAFNWINLTTIQTIIDYFDWHDSGDTAEIDVKVHVPADEDPGVKITGLVFYGEQS